MEEIKKHKILRSYIRKLARLISKEERWKPFKIYFVEHTPKSKGKNNQHNPVGIIFERLNYKNKVVSFNIYFHNKLIEYFDVYEFTNHLIKPSDNEKAIPQSEHAWELIAHELAHLKYMKHNRRFLKYYRYIFQNYFPTYIEMIKDYYYRVGGRAGVILE